jgi:putative lipoprotein
MALDKSAGVTIMPPFVYPGWTGREYTRRENMKSWLVSIALAAMLIALLGCTSDDKQGAAPGEPALSTLSGSVDFQRVGELKVDDVIVVELVDVTDGEEEAPVLASARIGEGVPSPYVFNLTYDPKLIRHGREYRVRAEIHRRDETVNRSAQSQDPFAAEELWLTFSRPTIRPLQMARTISLQGPDWYLHSLGGEDVDIALESRPYIHFDPQADTFRGFAGCNNFTGSYSLDGTRLELGPAAATRKACSGGMEIESRFLAVLQEVGSWQLEDGQMVLGDKERQEIARFLIDIQQQ